MLQALSFAHIFGGRLYASALNRQALVLHSARLRGQENGVPAEAGTVLLQSRRVQPAGASATCG